MHIGQLHLENLGKFMKYTTHVLRALSINMFNKYTRGMYLCTFVRHVIMLLLFCKYDFTNSSKKYSFGGWPEKCDDLARLNLYISRQKIWQARFQHSMLNSYDKRLCTVHTFLFSFYLFFHLLSSSFIYLLMNVYNYVCAAILVDAKLSGLMCDYQAVSCEFEARGCKTSVNIFFY